MDRRRERALAVGTALLAAWASGCGVRSRAVGTPAAAGLDYERDVAPVFRARCASCHGPEKQESYLRLDTHAEALKGGMSGSVILPGRSAESLLVRHLTGQASPRMPHEKPPLASDEIVRIVEWIDAGAPGPAASPSDPSAGSHWAYVKPRRPAVPPVRDAAWVRNPIDAFVRARLEDEGLSPSPPADRETLVRRLSLDLVGLPPTLEEIDAFLADEAPGAYERVVDRLLASPHYGERWARSWLDLARYADSNGYEKDRPRVAWPYRDWVIDALNRDVSFRQFTIEQLAGDMLPGATVDQKIATGFHRNSQLNQEGGIDVEEARFETLVDRVNTTGTVWLGSTIGCAQCHNHKFDPVSQKDYYRLLAFFDNGEYTVHGQGEEVVDRWIIERELELPTPQQAERRTALRLEADALRFDVDTRDLAAERDAFEKEIAAAPPVFEPLEIARFEADSGASFSRLEDGSVLVPPRSQRETEVAATDSAATDDGATDDADTDEGATDSAETKTDAYTVTLGPAPQGTTALLLEALPDPALPEQGPGRASSGAFVLTRIAVKEGDRPVPLAGAFADVSDPSRPAALAIDGHDDTGWGVTSEEQAGRRHFLLLVLDPEREPGPGPGRKAARRARSRTLTVRLEFRSEWPYPQASLGRFRLSATVSPHPLGGLPVPEAIRPALGTPLGERTAEQLETVDAWFRPLAPSLDAARDRLRAIQAELDGMGVLTALVMQERGSFERPSSLFRQRGSFTSPGERVYAAVPAALGRLPDDQPPNRLGLARWLVSEDNPLTARVAVNRIWQVLFGRGLVATSEDFGTQGERPSHSELLDWLAVELMEKGWSQKALVRLIVTSATYGQLSRTSAALLERDPDNVLLARGARFRVEAEMVRDIALAASGLLSPKVGGPSVYPRQPEGIWNVPYSDMRWETSTGEDLHRRGLYTFLRRSSPYPSLSVFDAPSREVCSARRVRTNTPLQALTILNDPVFVEAARALADRMAVQGGDSAAERIVAGHRLCTGHRPDPRDLDDLVAFYERERARLEREPDAARALLAVDGDAEAPKGAERAALTSVATVLLNLDATMTRE